MGTATWDSIGRLGQTDNVPVTLAAKGGIALAGWGRHFCALKAVPCTGAGVRQVLACVK